MFTTANLMKTDCTHFPDDELKLFYSIINSNIPNNTGISFYQCSNINDINIETKLNYWNHAL